MTTIAGTDGEEEEKEEEEEQQEAMEEDFEDPPTPGSQQFFHVNKRIYLSLSLREIIF